MNEKDISALNKSNSYNSLDYDEESRRIIHIGDGNIEKLRKEIRSDIDNLQTKIEKIMHKREKDYLSTFDEFMHTVTKDLRQKVEQIEKVEKEKRKSNDIKIVTSERDFFRQEAIRLNALCKEVTAKFEDSTRELKIQSHELNNLSKKWKESENMNKQLIMELERHIQINKELELNLKSTNDKDREVRDFKSGMVSSPDADDDNLEAFGKEKLVRIVEKLKYELKKERVRNHKILAELNKVLVDQNKLEKIFLDCFEESRKEIYNRKLKDVLTSKALGAKSSNLNMPQLNEVRYENFMAPDKKKLIENFILKEEIMNVIKEHVFKKIDYRTSVFDKKETENMQQTKNSFMKTENRLFTMSSFRKKAPATALTYTMQINRLKTPNY